MKQITRITLVVALLTSSFGVYAEALSAAQPRVVEQPALTQQQQSILDRAGAIRRISGSMNAAIEMMDAESVRLETSAPQIQIEL